MGERIVQEFFDHVPPRITDCLKPKELRALISILLALDDDSREGVVMRDELARWATGGRASNVSRDVVAVLVAGGLIERVMYETKAGPVEAYRNHPPRFRAPRWCDKPNAEGHHGPAVCFPNPTKAKAASTRLVDAAPVEIEAGEDFEVIAVIQRLRSTWAATAMQEQVRRAMAAGCSREIAWRAMAILADDGDTASPGRLMSLPRDPLMAWWFVQAEKEAAAARRSSASTAPTTAANTSGPCQVDGCGTDGAGEGFVRVGTQQFPCPTCRPAAHENYMGKVRQRYGIDDFETYRKHIEATDRDPGSEADELAPVVPFRSGRAKRSA